MKINIQKMRQSLTFSFKVVVLSLLSCSIHGVFSQAASATWSLTANGNAAISGNITAGAVSTGPGRYGIGAMSHTTDGVRSQNWNRSSYLSFSITSQYYNRDYYQYTVSPTPGNNFTVNTITLAASASTDTPSWFVFYSLDGFATSTQLGAVNSTSLTGLNIAIPPGTTLTLRIFGMDLLSNLTYFRNKNVVISGTTSVCPLLSQPSAITGGTTVCTGGAELYSVTNDPTATSYTWTLPSGWSGTSTTNSINVTGGTTGGTITVTANNACGSSTSQTLAVNTNSIPAQPSAITGAATICSAGNETYSVTNNPAATSYTWTLPSGWSGTSTTNSIAAANDANGGAITVTANNNCGSSVQQTLTVNANTIPAQPSAINGSATICENATQTYNVTNDPSATSYTWTLPFGWNGTSATNSIAATSGATGGTISVTANNICGSSTVQTFTVNTNNVLAQPSVISGSISVCANGNETYAVTNDPAATSYTWTLPSGWGGTSTTNSIAATSGTTGGTISVTANNICGSSTAQTFIVNTNNVLAQPSVISGSISVCANGNETYAVTNDPSATSYTWTLPLGWSGTSTTNSIAAISGGTGGTISVTANNACGNSVAQTVAVNAGNVPAQPSAINGNISVCASGNETYAVTNDPSATGYTWSLPLGWSGTSTTNSIAATSGTTGGTISVTANNACGSSIAQTITVTTGNVLAQPSAISGDVTICAGSNETYSVTNNPSATSYTWTLPSGWSGTSTTNSISVTSGTTGGTITVIANNACGSSTQQSINTTVTTINNSVAVNGITLTSNQTGATYQWIDCVNGNSIIPGATTQSFTPTANGQYAVRITVNGCDETSSCIVVNSVGIADIDFSQLSVFPNPGTGVFTISFDNLNQSSEMNVYTVSGQLVDATLSKAEKQLTVDISDQPAGVYLIQITLPDSIVYTKIIKQ
jgi:hypothetical protein